MDKLKTSPATEPVTAAELRDWLRGPSDTDEVLEELITAARQYFEEWTGLAVIEQTWILSLDEWPGASGSKYKQDIAALFSSAPVDLPRGPLISVEAIKTYDAEGGAATFAAENYYIDSAANPGRVITHSSNSWPQPGRPHAGIEIEYKAGYSADAADIAAAIKIGIKQLAAHYYENREAVGEMTLTKAPMGVQNLIKRYRIVGGL